MKELWLLIAGFIVWAVAFVAIYALQAVGCAIGLDAGILRALLIGAVVVALCIGAVPLWLVLRRRGAALRLAAVLCGVAALISTALTFSAVVWAGVC